MSDPWIRSCLVSGGWADTGWIPGIVLIGLLAPRQPDPSPHQSDQDNRGDNGSRRHNRDSGGWNLRQTT